MRENAQREREINKIFRFVRIDWDHCMQTLKVVVELNGIVIVNLDNK